MALTEVGSAQARATKPPAHFDLRKITTPILLYMAGRLIWLKSA
ncbi:hypothetical protein [Bradyrhizobium sp. AUGA SZCCT0283]|nr:hypothetical protein [Bradyrhizobium sp. AUGA SZCCT0283]